ncbi:MAG: His/Gly/Thr/Pro-type tRNA ligase C-terminal domain-containing protein [Bacilli bacterium]
MNSLNKMLCEISFATRLNGEVLLLDYGSSVFDNILSMIDEKLILTNHKKIKTSKGDCQIASKNGAPKSLFFDYIRKVGSTKYFSREVEAYFKEIQPARHEQLQNVELFSRVIKEIINLPIISGKLLINKDETYYIGVITSKGIIEIARSILKKDENGYYVRSYFLSKILDAIAIYSNDEEGVILSPAIAPYLAVIIPINIAQKGVNKKCKELLDKLEKKGLKVLYDETSETHTKKHEYYLKIGVPLIIEIGIKDVEGNSLNLFVRFNKEFIRIDTKLFVDDIELYLTKMQNDLYKKALTFTVNSIRNSSDFTNDKCVNVITKIQCCDKEKCLEKLKKMKDRVILVPFNQNSNSNCYFCNSSECDSYYLIKKYKSI